MKAGLLNIMHNQPPPHKSKQTASWLWPRRHPRIPLQGQARQRIEYERVRELNLSRHLSQTFEEPEGREFAPMVYLLRHGCWCPVRRPSRSSSHGHDRGREQWIRCRNGRQSKGRTSTVVRPRAGGPISSVPHALRVHQVGPHRPEGADEGSDLVKLPPRPVEGLLLARASRRTRPGPTRPHIA